MNNKGYKKLKLPKIVKEYFVPIDKNEIGKVEFINLEHLYNYSVNRELRDLKKKVKN